MDRIEKLEKIWGGIFGVIAIISAIVEMIFNGINIANFAGALKDIFGTLVVIIVFWAVIRDKITYNLAEKFELKLLDFEKRYSPLIFKVRDFKCVEEYEQGFCILKDFSKFINAEMLSEEEIEKYSSRESKSTTKFVDLPSVNNMINADFKICFRTLQSCIYDDDFLDNVAKAINSKFSEFKYEAIAHSKSNNLIVKIPKINSIAQVETLIALFEVVVIYFQIGNKGVVR